MPAKRIMSIAIVSSLALCSALSEGNAAEYAFTTYPLGTLAFGAGITPLPGFYVTEAVSFYSGRVDGNFDFGERVFNSGVKAGIFFDDVNLLFVPQQKVLGGLFGASVTIPAGNVDYKASASGIRGTVTDETSGGGLADTDFKFQLGWDGESFSHTAYTNPKMN